MTRVVLVANRAVFTSHLPTHRVSLSHDRVARFHAIDLLEFADMESGGAACTGTPFDRPILKASRVCESVVGNLNHG